jgi:hypothetical protein
MLKLANKSVHFRTLLFGIGLNRAAIHSLTHSLIHSFTHSLFKLFTGFINAALML